MENEIRDHLLVIIPDLKAIYLFGSFAKGEATLDSDIDIGIISEKHVDPTHILHIAQRLAAALNRDVDLLDIDQVPLVMQFRVITTGKNIYSKNPLALLEFETRIISMYQRFNEERKDIISEIINSGKVLS
jgi:predicted nucleotidyltransferase